MASLRGERLRNAPMLISIARPARQTTHRESPALATTNCLSRNNATTAVQPLDEPGSLLMSSILPRSASFSSSKSIGNEGDEFVVDFYHRLRHHLVLHRRFRPARRPRPTNERVKDKEKKFPGRTRPDSPSDLLHCRLPLRLLLRFDYVDVSSNVD